jgi:hypothetical protein
MAKDARCAQTAMAASGQLRPAQVSATIGSNAPKADAVREYLAMLSGN